MTLKVAFTDIEAGYPTAEPWNKLQVTTPLQDDLFPQSAESRLVAATDWLKYRLQECVRSHTNCMRKGEKQMAVPGRLLDLETGFGPYTIRLVKPDVGFSTPYMTLSHRWGNVLPCQTTTANISNRYFEIKPVELPTTFQHAIMITRRLGIRFLWIDSLCIVQDDPSDWEMEASKMASIYSSSYLTIAAISSLNSNGGCIPEFPPSAYFKINAKGTEHTSVYIRQDQFEVDLSRAHSEITGSEVPWSIPLVNIIDRNISSGLY